MPAPVKPDAHDPGLRSLRDRLVLDARGWRIVGDAPAALRSLLPEGPPWDPVSVPAGDRDVLAFCPFADCKPAQGAGGAGAAAGGHRVRRRSGEGAVPQALRDAGTGAGGALGARRLPLADWHGIAPDRAAALEAAPVAVTEVRCLSSGNPRLAPR